MSKRVTIIDIRKEYQYNLGHIPNAINIPYQNILNTPFKYLKKEDKYIIYCQAGNNSKILKQHLSNLGYEVEDIKGGYNEYIKNI